MPFNSDNDFFKIGVENLLTLEPEFNPRPFYSENVKIDDYGAESINRKLDKTKLCDWICEEVPTEKQVVILGKLKNIIDELIKEIK